MRLTYDIILFILKLIYFVVYIYYIFPIVISVIFSDKYTNNFKN